MDAVDYLNNVAGAVSASVPAHPVNQHRTRLIITSNCLDASFENIMLRYASYALILSTKTENGRTGSTSTSSNSSDSNRVNDNDKAIKLTMRRPISPSESEEVVIFSRINFADGRLICHP